MKDEKIIFCTYFDKNYLLKGLCLLSSFFRYHPQSEFWVLCFDDYTLKIIKKIKIRNIFPIAVEDFEKGDKDLLAAKKNRTKVEYCFTSTPSLPIWIFKKDKNVQKVIYLDADLFFFSSIKPALREMGTKSIYAAEHRFASNQKYRIQTSGRFNVGFQIYNRDPEALSCLKRWRRQCLDWCHQYSQNGKYADQAYLNDWPKLYPNLTISRNLGIDAAPWNINQYRVTRKEDKIYINKNRLICYHFHQFEIQGENEFNLCTTSRLSSLVINYIYKPYLEEIKKQIALIKEIDPNFKVVPPSKNFQSLLKEKFIKYFGPLYWQLMTGFKN